MKGEKGEGMAESAEKKQKLGGKDNRLELPGQQNNDVLNVT